MGGFALVNSVWQHKVVGKKILLQVVEYVDDDVLKVKVLNSPDKKTIGKTVTILTKNLVKFYAEVN